MKSYFYTKKYYHDGVFFVRKYSRSYELGNEVPRKSSTGTKSNVVQASLSRAKTNVRLICFFNPQLIHFLTLTNSDCPTEEEANYRFKQFLKKVKAHDKSFQFVGVKEYQKRGSIHWHLLVNHCPNQIISPNNPNKFNCADWKYGFSDFQYYDVNKTDGNFKQQLYLFKYLTKGKQKLFTNFYVRSRNLNKVTDPIYIHSNYFTAPNEAYNVYLKTIHHVIDKKNIVDLNILEYNYNIIKSKE